ncbi:MAG: hypothetical protein ABSG81_03925 [Acidimicrobiales bacterium]|jgi:hypothetical protein
MLGKHISAFCRIAGHQACQEHSIAQCECPCHPVDATPAPVDGLFIASGGTAQATLPRAPSKNGAVAKVTRRRAAVQTGMRKRSPRAT